MADVDLLPIAWQTSPVALREDLRAHGIIRAVRDA
jgi:hypothetical protein